MARRFDTRFFAAELPEGAEATFEADEVVAHRWSTPRAALDAMAAGDIAMWVPTSATLQQLEHARRLAEIRERIVPGAVAAPRVVAEAAGSSSASSSRAPAACRARRSTPTSSGGAGSCSSTRATRRTRPRRRHSTPRPQRGGEIVAIALTHVDPDHAAGAEGARPAARACRSSAGPAAGGPSRTRSASSPTASDITDGDVGLEAIATPGAATRSGRVRHRRRRARRPSASSPATWSAPRARPLVLAWPTSARAASVERLAALGAGALLPGHGSRSAGRARRRRGVTPPGSG